MPSSSSFLWAFTWGPSARGLCWVQCQRAKEVNGQQSCSIDHGPTIRNRPPFFCCNSYHVWAQSQFVSEISAMTGDKKKISNMPWELLVDFDNNNDTNKANTVFSIICARHCSKHFTCLNSFTPLPFSINTAMSPVIHMRKLRWWVKATHFFKYMKLILIFQIIKKSKVWFLHVLNIKVIRETLITVFILTLRKLVHILFYLFLFLFLKPFTLV